MTVDIFAAAEEAQRAKCEGGSNDTQVLLVGAKQAGKSTLMRDFLGQTDDPKPTAALEYRFARRSAATSASSRVANLWELGGGTQLAELLRVVLVPAHLCRSTVGITLDMSSPNDALETLLFWLDAVRRHVDVCEAQLRADPDANAGALQSLKRRDGDVWERHADAAVVRPIGVALLIFAHRWDLFEAAFPEPEAHKLATRALRYFAHLHGASLVCSHHRDKQAMGSARSLLHKHAFGASPNLSPQLDHSRPVLAPAGADSLESIGPAPSLAGLADGDATAAWQAAFEARFPAAKRKEAADLSVVDADQFAEDVIDELRRHKRGEVEQARRDARLREQ